jgi:hypothetical protein
MLCPSPPSADATVPTHDRQHSASAVTSPPAAADRELTLVWRPGCASCAAAKEFLTVNGIPFESVNPVEPDGAARWSELGRPRIPSLVLDGATTAIYHTSQLASLLGLTTAGRGEALRLAWDLSSVVEAWSELLAPLDFELMNAPTPSRGRSVRNLTVNVHVPLGEMAAAWETGIFTWDTDEDERIAAELADADAVRAYAEARSAGWIAFLMDAGDDLGQADRSVRAGAEELAFSALLDAQRFHAAFHYRQIATFLHPGAPPPFDLARLEGLRLPASVY